MARKLNPLLKDFLDEGLPPATIHWETLPPGVNPWHVWDGYDEGVEGWVPVWYPIGDSPQVYNNLLLDCSSENKVYWKTSCLQRKIGAHHVFTPSRGRILELVQGMQGL
jgi:hypothetical protein